MQWEDSLLTALGASAVVKDVMCQKVSEVAKDGTAVLGREICLVQVHNGPAVALPGGALDVVYCEVAGDFVEIHGLAGAIELNGKVGQLVKYCQESGRFSVRIDGVPGFKAIKRDNVRRLASEWEYDDLPSFLRLSGCRSQP